MPKSPESTERRPGERTIVIVQQGQHAQLTFEVRAGKVSVTLQPEKPWLEDAAAAGKPLPLMSFR